VSIRTALAVLVAATVTQTGAAFAQSVPQGGPPAMAPVRAQYHHGGGLYRGLNLSPDQRAQIKSIRAKHMRAQRQEIMSVLTPDQRQQVQQRIAARRAQRRNAPPEQTQPQ
jgi:Spy/CpxP family protein refolding chaperone